MKFYIQYPDGNRQAPFDNYEAALTEARLAARRVGVVVIIWLYSDHTPAAHIVQNNFMDDFFAKARKV